MRIIGHRGARSEAPENTLGGFRYLQQMGIRGVEFDVRQLNDNSLVVVHDDSLIRTAGREVPIYSLSAKDLQQFNQAHFWDNWQHEPLPLLNQVIDILKDFEHLEIEVKAVKDKDAAKRLVDHLIPFLEPIKQNAYITSFDAKILQVVNADYPDYQRGLLVQMPIGHYAIDIATQNNCQLIGWKNELIDHQVVNKSVAAGLQVSAWTVNDIYRARLLKDWGVHYLITDFPKKMQDEL